MVDREQARRWKIMPHGCWWEVVGGEWGIEPHPQEDPIEVIEAVPDRVADAAREVVAAANGGHPGYGTRLARALVALDAALKRREPA